MLLGCEVTAGNLGVAALGHALVRWLREVDPACEISMQTPGQWEPVQVETPGGAVHLQGVPLHYSRSLRARFGTHRFNSIHSYGRMAPRQVRS